MKQICELNDQLILGQAGLSQASPRYTARAVVKNANELYAVMHSPKFGLHSLPGGGMEHGEDALTTLRREIYEETGCTCDEIFELGIVTENRASLDYTQINYYYAVTTADCPGPIHLTEAEQRNGTAIKWVPFPELVRLIQNQTFDRVQAKYLKARDVAALYTYMNASLEHTANRLNIPIQFSTIFDKDAPGYQVQTANRKNAITLNAAKIPLTEYRIHAGYHARSVLLPTLRLETERLLLRRYQPPDAGDCFDFLSNEADAYLDCCRAFPERNADYYERVAMFAQRETQYMIQEKQTGRVIGTVNVFPDDSRAVDTMEIGYSISHTHQRQGYAFEALSALLNLLQRDLHLELVTAGILPENAASEGLLTKLGFCREGLRRKAVWHEGLGRPVDLIYFYREP